MVEKKYQNKSNKKDSEESVKGKGKGKEVEETSEDVEMNDDVEEEDKSDEELLDDDDEGQDIEALDSEGEDEDENAPPPVHESLLKDSKSNGKSNKKNKDDDEPKEVKDRRTLFIGNLPIEAVKSRVSNLQSLLVMLISKPSLSMGFPIHDNITHLSLSLSLPPLFSKSITKALKKHLISFSPYPTLTSISSIRYRSIPFSTPTDDFIAGDDEASAKAAKRRERTATYREAQALADKEENGDDPSSSSTNQVKSYLNSRQKRKVAFIKQDFNSHASSVNAYVTLNQVDLEEVKKLREEYQEEEGEGIPIPPINLNGSLLASLISNISNNTVFQKRHLRIDLVTPLSVNDLLQSGLEKTSSLFKAMIPSTSASNSNGSGGATIGRDEKKTLFVGNLDFEASEEDLREFFEDLLIEERGNPPENEGGKSLRSLVFERRKKADPISDKAKESKDDEEDEDGDSDSDSDSEDGGEEESSSSWVSSVRIIRDPSTQLGKGFAYVLFKDETCVDELMALHETEETFLNSGRPQVGGMRGKGKDLVAPPSNYGKEFRRRLKFKKRPLRLSRCKSGGNKGKGGKDESGRNVNGDFSRTKSGGGSEPSTPANRRDRSKGAPTPGGTSPASHLSKSKSSSSSYDGPKTTSLDSTLLSSLSKEERTNLKKNDPGRLARRMEKKNQKKASNKIQNLDEEGRKVGMREKVNLNRNSIAGGKGKGKGKDGKDGKKRSSVGNQAVGKKSKNPGGKKPVSKN